MNLNALRVVLIGNLASRARGAGGAAGVSDAAALAVLGDGGAARGGRGAGGSGHGRGPQGGGRGRVAAAAAAAAAAAGEDGGTRDDVAVEVAVDVGRVAGVGVLEGTRDPDGGRAGAAAARDRDLGAAQVELGDSAGPGVVDAELLDAEKVLAAGNARRDVEGVGICVATSGWLVSNHVILR